MRRARDARQDARAGTKTGPHMRGYQVPDFVSQGLCVRHALCVVCGESFEDCQANFLSCFARAGGGARRTDWQSHQWAGRDIYGARTGPKLHAASSLTTWRFRVTW
jgi:hypothetical protein